MDQQTALEFARRVWGKHAFVRIHKKHMPGDHKNIDEQGYVIPSGPITSFEIGYKRKGKYGGYYLSTPKGRGEPNEGFRGAFEDALRQCEGTRAGVKLTALIDEIRSA